jgi:hypothetical protein
MIPSEAADSQAPARRRWEAMMPSLAGVAATAVALAWGLGGVDFCLDDAYIHLAYARSLSEGSGLSYNPGDWETGSTSPAWALLLAAWPVPEDPVAAVKALGALLHGVTAACVTGLAMTLARRDSMASENAGQAAQSSRIPPVVVGAIAGALYSVHAAALQGATSGMEVPLATATLAGTTWATVRGRWALGAVLASIAVFARPESLVFICALGIGGAVAPGRRWHALAPAIGGCLAMSVWVLGSLAVSGWPLPNTYYVKAGAEATGSDAASWAYLVEVLWSEPWLRSVVGLLPIAVLLAAAAPNRRPSAWLLLGGWALTIVAISASRPLHPGVGFFESRYFTIVAWIPLILVALGTARLPRWLAAISVIGVLAGNAWGGAQTFERQRSQERDVRLVHVDPARAIASLASQAGLAENTTVAVEGAGASRFFAPRTMRVLDVIGLNWGALAHAPSDPAKACLLVQAEPALFVLPEHVAAPLSRVFRLETLQVFASPDYAMTRTPMLMRVHVLRNAGPQPGWVERCGQRPTR